MGSELQLGSRSRRTRSCLSVGSGAGSTTHHLCGVEGAGWVSGESPELL